MPIARWIEKAGISARLLAIVVGAVLPLLALLLVDAADDRAIALRTAEDGVRRTALLAAERQSRVFDEARVLLSAVRLNPDVTVEGAPACADAMTALAARHKQFMTMGVVRADGLIACHSVIRSPKPFSDEELLGKTLSSRADDFVVGRLVIGGVTKRPTIITARPLVGESGAVEGMVFASVDLSGLAQRAELGDRGAAMDMAVVDASEGKVVAGLGAMSAFVGTSFDGHPLVEALRDRPLGGVASVASLTGERAIVAFAPLRGAGLSRPTVVVGLPETVAFREADSLALSHLTLAVAVGTLAFIAAWLLGSRMLVQPIRGLTAAARRLSDGDLTARARAGGWQPQEIRLLAMTLNGLAERVDAGKRRLEALANEDGLTGLANRRRFDGALEVERSRSVRTGAPLSLLLIDVDHFKSFNDLYGHLAGDDCLRRIAGALRSAAARTEDVVARYGGEELAVILPNTNAAGAATVAEKIVAAIAELALPHAGAPKGVVSVSCGSATVVATAGSSGDAAEALIEAADRALYAAKSAGRDRHRAAA